MNSDNNLLLIILIGVVMFWIFNINTTTDYKENFKQNFKQNTNTNTKNEKKKHLSDVEYYRNDGDNEAINDASRVKSPLVSGTDDYSLIDKLYLEKQNSSKSEDSKMVYSNGMPSNSNQKIFQTPSTQHSNSIDDIYTDMAKQFTTKQEMYSNETINPIDDKQQHAYYNLKDESYLLLPKDNLPDDKFKSVTQNEPRKTLTTTELLPTKKNSDWFQVPNEKFNLLEAVDLEIPEIKVGIDTVGQSRKNATYDLRAAPPNPKFVVSPWNNSTIEQDYNTKPLC